MNQIQRSSMDSLASVNRLAIALLLCLTVAGGLFGCETKTGVAKEPVVTKQIGTSAKKIVEEPVSVTEAEPVPVAAPADVLAESPKRMPYNPVGKVDPFTPLYKEEVEKKPQEIAAKPKAPERPRTPLEKLDLGQLKLTAVITTQQDKRALVEEATGKGYVIKLGTRIGLERGAVVEIDGDRIVIEHEGEDDFGNATSRKRELKLQKPPGD